MANYKNLITSFEGLILILSILIFIYYYVKRRIFYWGSKIPGPKPWPLIGNAWYFIGSEPGKWKSAFKNLKKIHV